ncbi:putative helicase mov-10-B.1 [Temnothorax longispinosus]|uniref:Putative helicase mov-10-B.1 n=1 Tax=Temnothorax longispinosus TaxID=300112 RepID=A0A4S2JA59_9HYME|nr:putative helicase mov-10-B.1 [Temnothorax longispinosus]
MQNLKSLNGDLHVIKPDCEVELRDNTKKVIFAKIVKVVGNDVTIKPYYPENPNTLKMKEKRFNIEFVDRHWSLRCCHYALKIVSKCNWIEIVYPRLRTNCTDMEIDIEWTNADLKENEPQKQAVRKILNKTAYPAPYIIFGPPGTGKTVTLVETICQIVRHFPTKNILVCTSSNAAADEITKRLIKYIPTNLIYRMSTVKNEIQPCANFVQESTLFLSKELLLRKKIIITTLVSSVRLIDVNFRENHFSYIIIDEASQAVEPEMLIPLAITNKESDEKTRFHAQIVIAGRSMLERLMDDCDPYKKQDGKYNPNYITKLVQNFRSHENILHVSNKQFYCGDLKICGGADIRMALNWSQLPNKNFPMIFQEVLGTETRSVNRSVCNTAEVLAVLMYVSILIKAKFGKHVITPKDIGIVTPFKQQQLDITHHLEAMKLKGITVGTVETFQGQERNVMILSTVRSKAFEHNGKEHIGFLSNPKLPGLKDRKGSSFQAIKKYIVSTYKVDGEKVAPFIKHYLKTAVSAGAVVQTKGKGATGSFKLSTDKPKDKAKGKAQRASLVHSDTWKAGTKKDGREKTAIARKPAAAVKKTTAKKAPESAKKAAPKTAAAKTAVKKGKAAAEPKSPSKAKKAVKAPAAKTKTPKPKKATAKAEFRYFSSSFRESTELLNSRDFQSSEKYDTPGGPTCWLKARSLVASVELNLRLRKQGIDNLTLPMEAANAEEKEKQGYVQMPETISDNVPLETIKVLKILSKETLQKSKHQNGIPVKHDKLKSSDNNVKPSEEFLVYVRVYEPFKSHSRLKYKISVPVLKLKSVISILGCQTLYELRQKIICQSDLSIIKEISEKPNQRPGPMAKDVYPSGFFYIEDTFYNDTSVPTNIDYSNIILEWATIRDIGPFKVATMDAQINSLYARFGFPWVYQHQGSCEHLIVLTDARLVTDDDVLISSAYPRIERIRPISGKHCIYCGIFNVHWVVTEHDRIPHDIITDVQ